MKTSNSEIISAVRKDTASRDKVIENIYNDVELKHSIMTYITKNGGTSVEASDAFTFAIVTFIQQCYRPQFQLSKDINAYIYSIAKYEWFRIAKKKPKIVSEDFRPEIADDFNIESNLISNEKHMSLKKAMAGLDKKCREILTMWANNLRMREIAVKMVYKSEGMARKKKHECVKKLRLLIQDI